jgi:hypothetical protein
MTFEDEPIDTVATIIVFASILEFVEPFGRGYRPCKNRIVASRSRHGNRRGRREIILEEPTPRHAALRKPRT